MNTQNTSDNGKTVIVKDITNELRDIFRKNILSKLFDKRSSLSSAKDAEILYMVLIEDKNLIEVAEKLNLTHLQISHYFNNALRRVSLRFATFNMQVEKVEDLEAEALFLRSKLRNYERKEDKVLELPPETRELLFKSVRNMGFSNRVWHILHSLDVETLSDLVKLTKHKFLTCRGVGKVSMREVSDFLASKGLSWGMKI